MFARRQRAATLVASSPSLSSAAAASSLSTASTHHAVARVVACLERGERQRHHVVGRAPNDRRSEPRKRQLDAAGTRIGHARRDAVLVDCLHAPSCVQRTQLADSASSLSSSSRSESAERTTRGTHNRLPSPRRTRQTRPDRSAASATRNRVRHGSLALVGRNQHKQTFKVQKCSLHATTLSNIIFLQLCFSLSNRKLLHLFALSLSLLMRG